MNPATPKPLSRRRSLEQTPLQRALGLLSRREHSQRELARKLKARGCDADEVETVLAHLITEGWQDDARFAEMLVRARAQAGYGPRYIRAELLTHGVNDALIASALDHFEGDWLENARYLLQRRFGNTLNKESKHYRKAADLLARRGFDSDYIRRISS